MAYSFSSCVIIRLNAIFLLVGTIKCFIIFGKQFLFFSSLQISRKISRYFKNFLQNDFSKVSSLLKSYFKFLKLFMVFIFNGFWTNLYQGIAQGDLLVPLLNFMDWLPSGPRPLSSRSMSHNLWLMEHDSYNWDNFMTCLFWLLDFSMENRPWKTNQKSFPGLLAKPNFQPNPRINS